MTEEERGGLLVDGIVAMALSIVTAWLVTVWAFSRFGIGASAVAAFVMVAALATYAKYRHVRHA